MQRVKLNLVPHEINSPKQANQKEKVPFIMAVSCKRIYLKRNKNKGSYPKNQPIIIHGAYKEEYYKNLSTTTLLTIPLLILLCLKGSQIYSKKQPTR